MQTHKLANVGCWAALSLIMGLVTTSMAKAEETTIPVEISSGHTLGKQDFGRPVTLIAAALKVQPEVFRQAFSGVTPARGRGPTGDQARKNKAALLKVLAPHGVSNERLDEVSDYYRFRPESGKIWTHKPAEAHAVIVKGKIDRIVVTEPGHGYCSTPTIVIPGFEKAEFEVTLSYSTDFKKNGAVSAITLK